MSSSQELIHTFNLDDTHVTHPFRVSFFEDKINCPHCRQKRQLDMAEPELKIIESDNMKIDFVEIKNFRKLKECRIDFDPKKTLLVGANNSGKTSAMVALRKFLLAPNEIEFRDISIGNWIQIDREGEYWEDGKEVDGSLNEVLPLIDVWLDVPLKQIHYVVNILPTVDWDGGAIGVRLGYEFRSLEALKADYIAARNRAKFIEEHSTETPKPSVEPRSLSDFIQSNLSHYVELKSYSLDTDKLKEPDCKGNAQVQSLENNALELQSNPFKGLINIREIPALRDFSEGRGAVQLDSKGLKSEKVAGSLSSHVRGYYEEHLDNSDEVNLDDIDAFGAIQKAELAFDNRLKTGFAPVWDELKELGVPGINNPNIVINTRFKSIEGLTHDSAVQYKVSEPEDGQSERYLPESFAGLGYQNLIAMVFLLMRFRQDWIEPSKDENGNAHIEPLQLVMIEEPEAHLHAQVQQVFIKKAYTVLRNHEELEGSSIYATQLLVSTHSSHVSHEVDFSNLRYFRRHLSETQDLSPISTVVDLSNIYGEDEKTLRFVKRYIKATDCDLFFADGAIFVEGQAERILVPHFIRDHFGDLWKRYISLIDIGGSNARRFEPLVRALGLKTLVITDLDAGIGPKRKKTTPERGCDQVTTNPTLKKWHPLKESLDELLDMDDEDHAVRIDNEYDLYMAYQKEVPDPSNTDSSIIPRTFEDALVYRNFEVLQKIEGSTTTRKIGKLLDKGLEGEELASELFEVVNKAEKAAFAIDCLIAIDDGVSLAPPEYIASGLKWLEENLNDTPSAEPEGAV